VLPTGCLVFSDRPLPHRPGGGLCFALRVNAVTPSFQGMPLLGFTRRRPRDESGLHPQVSTCLGESLFIGKQGQAFARDKPGNFAIGFKQPPQNEVQTWSSSGSATVAPSAEAETDVLKAGDILQCVWTINGRLELWQNEAKVLDFDISRHIDAGTEYFAAIDVCLSATSVSVVDMPEPKPAPDVVAMAPAHQLCGEKGSSLHADAGATPPVMRSEADSHSRHATTCGASVAAGDTVPLADTGPTVLGAGTRQHGGASRSAMTTALLLCSLAAVGVLLGTQRLRRAG